MPHFNTIPLDDAKRTAGLAPTVSQYAGFVAKLGPGQAGHLTLVAGETMRGVKVRLTRAATAAGVRLTARSVGNDLYFWRAAPVRRRGPRTKAR